MDDDQMIEHFSHHHPLTRCDVAVMNSIKKDDNDDEEQVMICCYGCEEPIIIKLEQTSKSSRSNPGYIIYGCKECNLYLHKSCADLPMEYQSPCHPPHPLTLLHCQNQHFCTICCPPITGFAYGCADCNFYAHIRCHSLVSSPEIAARKLEDGGHLFFLWKTAENTHYSCDVCEDHQNGMDTYLFQCMIPACPRRMHFRCTPLPLPNTVKYEYHYDELTLTERFVDEEGLDYCYCDACEMGRDQRHAVYVCRECGYAAHPTCVIFQMLPSIIAEYEESAKARSGGVSANDVTLGNMNSKIQENLWEQDNLRYELSQLAAKIDKLEQVRTQYLASKNIQTTATLK